MCQKKKCNCEEKTLFTPEFYLMLMTFLTNLTPTTPTTTINIYTDKSVEVKNG